MSTRESADEYAGIVVVLNKIWRVIESRDGIQWIFSAAARQKCHVETIGAAGATAGLSIGVQI